MLLEPNCRYFKIYDIVIGAKANSSQPVPLMTDDPTKSSVEKFIQGMKRKGAVKEETRNDLLELVSVERSVSGNLIMFFHREAWKVSDPSYRSSKSDGSVSVSKYIKAPDEEQAVSAHLIISKKRGKQGYRCVIEEVPGISMNSVLRLLRSQVFPHMTYNFNDPKTGKPRQTYVTIKALGLASASLKETLKKSRWDTVTLTRPADNSITDGMPWARSKPQVQKIKVNPELSRSDYYENIKKLVTRATDKGWDNVRVELEFADDRSKNIAINRDDLGRDIMFVQAKRVNVSKSLDNCSECIVPELVQVAEALL